MRKKLTLMFVALLAVAAFAATQALNRTAKRAGTEKSYTIVFHEWTAATETQTGDNSSQVASLEDLIAEGADYVSSFEKSNVYQARVGRGIKLGTSSKTGSLTLTLAQAVKPTKIVVSARAYSNTETTFKLFDTEYSDLTTDFADKTITFDGNTEVTKITFATTAKRAYVKSVTVYYEEPAQDTYIVAGSSSDIFEVTWDATNEANKMTKQTDGTYAKTYTVTSAANDIQLKVVKNENEWYGDANGNNVKFNLTGAGEFTVTINPETGVVSVTGDIVALPAPATPTYYVVGNMTDWAVNEDYKMTASTTDPNVYEYTMDLTTESQFKVVKVEGSAQAWYPDGMGNNYGENGEITADGNYTISFNPAGNVDGWFYGYIKVVSTTAPAEPAIAIPSYATVFDYEAAGQTGETLTKVNLNFQVNMGSGKEDRTDRNFRGYQNYTGTILPAECQVATGEEPKLDEDGLKVAQDRYLSVYGLNTGDKVIIEYTGVPAGKTPTYCPGTSVDTKAAINGTELVSAVSPIASGDEIEITEAGSKNYIIMSIFNGMRIKRVAIIPQATSFNYLAAGQAGETLTKVNLNYQVNMGSGKEDRTDRNFRGYQNYTGTILPAECQVATGEEPKLDEDGLKVAQDRYLSVYGLNTGDKVIIEYTGVPAGKTPTYCPGTSVDTKAAINGTELVSAVSPIASGDVIEITKAGSKNYIIMSIFNGMRITNVTILPSPVTYYNANIGSVENGTVSVDKDVATEGETVNVTATPDKTFKLSSITVKDADGNNVEVNGTSFTMPAKNVTVSATFEYNIVEESTDAIDVEVPANLGENGGATDLATFLDSYLQNSPNPAYIKLTLKAGAEYTISKPLTVRTAIAIEGDANEPATVDASALSGAFVQIDEQSVNAEPNDKGFFTSMYDVTFKNFEVKSLSGSLFNDNGLKYQIPYFTVENVLVEATGAAAVIDMTGSVVENLTVTKSTMNAAALAYNAPVNAAEAGVTSQTITASYNTFYKVTGLQLASAGMPLAPATSNRRLAPAANNVSLDFNHNVVISNSFAFQGSVPSSMLVQYNSFVKEDGTDNNETLANVPGVGGTVTGNLVFANPDEVASGNLGLGACPQKTEKIGDPRWLQAALKVTAEALAGVGDDLAALINQGVENGFNKFELTDNARYSVKQAIVTDKALSITGNNVKIDVEHSDVFILLNSTPAVDLINDYYRMDAITLKGLTVTGLKNSIIYDNNTKYCVVDLTIDDCVLGLETVATKNQAFISFQQGGVKDFTMKNSTVYQAGAEENNYFLRYNNSARLDRYGYDKNVETQSINYINNTFYKVGKNGQWGNYNGIAGQAYSEFHVTGNIWVDCGNGQIARRLLGGRNASSYKTCEFNNNTYWFNGAAETGNTSYDEGNQLTTDPGFKKPAEANFTLSAYSEQATEKTGDPRWNAEPHYNTAIEGVAAEKADDGAWYTIQGVRVDKPAKGLYIHNGRKVVIK